MKKTVEISSKRLRMAREVQGLTASKVASQVGVSPQSLSHYERGAVTPSKSTLTRLAVALDFPARFFLIKREVERVEGFHYRALVKNPARERKRVEILATLLHEFLEQLDAWIPLPRFRRPDVSELPREAARELREQLDLGDGPIENVVSVLEALGVWVHVLPASSKIDGFCTIKEPRAYVFLNWIKGDAYRSRFDAAHELFHLIHHWGKDPSKEQEHDAHKFASEFLIAEDSWKRDAPTIAKTNPKAYLPHKHRWKASAAALIRRSRDLDILSAQQYTSAMVRYSGLGWRKGEPGMYAVPHEQPQLLAEHLERLSTLEEGVLLEELEEAMALPNWLMEELLGQTLTLGAS